GANSVGAAVSAAKTLVGKQANDTVGRDGVTVLAGGRYVVASSYWANGTAAQAGAATFGQVSGIAGAVSADNSLVGTVAGSRVAMTGTDFMTGQTGVGVQVVSDQLGTYTNYLVASQNWSDPVTGVSRVGAITWVNGDTGYVYGASSANRGAAVSAQNSLVGNYANDAIGSTVTALSATINGTTFKTGDALIISTTARVGDDVGTVTLMPGKTGMAGRIGWRNSIAGFNDASQDHTGPLTYAVLPYAATSEEAVSYRPLIWTNVQNYYSGNGSLKALTVVQEDAATPLGTVGHTAGTTAAGDGSSWSTTGAFMGNSAQFGSYGYTGDAGSGTLAFGTFSGLDNVVITPFTLTSLLNAGTDVTLQASNNITVLKPIIVSANGQGGDLKLEAGRSINLYADVFTDNGNFTALANLSFADGVIDASGNVFSRQQVDSNLAGSATLAMAPGVKLDTGTGTATLELRTSSDKSVVVQVWNGSAFVNQTRNADANGDVVLGDVNAGNLLVSNFGGSASTSGDIRTNTGSHIDLLKTGALDGRFELRAWRDVVLGQASSTQSVLIDNAMGASGQIDVTLQSDLGGNGVGADILKNTTVHSHDGDIAVGGGTAVDTDGRPTGFAQGNGAAAGNGFTRSAGVSLSGATQLDAGNGNVALAGRGTSTSSNGIAINGNSTLDRIAVGGKEVQLKAQRVLGGSTGAAITLANANIGDGAVTDTVKLLASGYDNANSGHGSVVLDNSVALAGTGTAALTVASDVDASLAQFGGAAKVGADGLWLAGDNGSGNGGNLGTLLRNSSGFGAVLMGSSTQTGVTSVQDLNLAAASGGAPFAFSVGLIGGAGGVTVNGASNDFTGLAEGAFVALGAVNGTLSLGGGVVKANNLLMTGNAINQQAGGSLRAGSVTLSGAATMALLGTTNAIDTLAGTLGGGQIVNGKTLHIGSGMGVDGLASTGTLTVKTLGS
ncbi:MAG: filamentous hemagglutinin family outer membrane protein, partial [Marmoricola sp.]|nr:filamentous hemagglutinin family outer membrane protein [Marmoricola sp.]